MEVGWYVRSDGREALGPIKAELVVDGIRAGRIPITAAVCPVGSDRWVPAIEFPPFADAVREVSPPPPIVRSEDWQDDPDVVIAVPLVRLSTHPRTTRAADDGVPRATGGQVAAPEEAAPLYLVTRASARPPAEAALRDDDPPADAPAGDDLLAELFDAMHELHFLPDAIDAGDFCLRICDEKLSCEDAVVHVYESDRRDFVVTNARGAAASRLLRRRHPATDRSLAAVMSERRPILLDAAAGEAERRGPSGGVEGDQDRPTLLAPVMPGGRFLGAIELLSTRHGRPFARSDADALAYIAQHFADFIATHGVVVAPGPRHRQGAHCTPSSPGEGAATGSERGAKNVS